MPPFPNFMLTSSGFEAAIKEKEMRYAQIPKGKPTGFAKFGPGGPSVEEAKAAAIDAGEVAKTTRLGEIVPKWVQNSPTAAAQRAPATGHVEEFEQTRVPQAQSPRAVPVEVDTMRQRFEDNDFVIEIFREKNIWVAEINYRLNENGQAGIERFEASSHDELMMKMAKGKAAATKKIRQQNRQLKEGFSADDWNFFWSLSNLTQAEADKLPATARETVVDATQVTQIKAFWESTPEAARTREEYVALEAFMKKGNQPVTIRNLQHALRELIADGVLVSALAPAATSVQAPVYSAPAPPQVAPAVAAPEQRKRGGVSGLVPGRSSASAAPDVSQNDGSESEAVRARRLASTPEGMKALRREAIPSLNPNRAGRR